MPWKTVNRILGLASINQTFRQQLQQDPATAIKAYGFELTPEELEVFCTFASLPFPQFCEQLSDELFIDERE